MFYKSIFTFNYFIRTKIKEKKDMNDIEMSVIKNIASPKVLSKDLKGTIFGMVIQIFYGIIIIYKHLNVKMKMKIRN